jgi:Na+/H+ antiporter NhaA
MPTAARIFLLALAIFDDLIAIGIIAIFYTTKLEPAWLIASFIVAGAFRFAEKSRFPNKWLIRASFGLVLWYTIYQSGVHATVAGVLLAMETPFALFFGLYFDNDPLTLRIISGGTLVMIAMGMVIWSDSRSSKPGVTKIE